MSPKLPRNPSDYRGVNPAAPLELWVTVEATRSQTQARRQPAGETQCLEEMTHWRFRNRHESVRHDGTRHLLDDNPTSG